jgi:predicted aldo/keto reductase-like oxidoreductase
MSELIVGHAFKQMKDRPIISTKCGPWNASDADGARRMIEQSLKRLHVDVISIYNMWCIKSLDEYKFFMKPGGVYEGIVKARDEGLIEHICCSTHIDGKGLAEIVADNRTESVTLGYNALNFAYRREGVEACYKSGKGVVVMNPLGGGIIPRHADLFSFIKSTPEQSVVDAALRFLIGQEEISVALVGASSVAELEEAAKAAENVKPVTAETIATMKAALSEKLNSLCTGCAYCDECPVEIPIPKLMDSFNEASLGNGEMQPVFDRLQGHWGIDGESAKKCVECGQCEGLCTQHLPIIERLKLIAAAV